MNWEKLYEKHKCPVYGLEDSGETSWTLLKVPLWIRLFPTTLLSRRTEFGIVFYKRIFKREWAMMAITYSSFVQELLRRTKLTEFK